MFLSFRFFSTSVSVKVCPFLSSEVGFGYMTGLASDMCHFQKETFPFLFFIYLNSIRQHMVQHSFQIEYSIVYQFAYNTQG